MGRGALETVPPLVLIGHAAFQALRGPFGDARGVRLLEAVTGH